MSRRKILLLVGISAAVLLAVPLSIRYEELHAVHVVHPMSIGASTLPRSVLIATQDTPFKDALVSAIVEKLRRRGVYIRQLDISELPHVNATEWSVIIVLHGWQFGRAPGEVRDFVAKVRDKSKLIVVTTSGGGRSALPGIDAISAASVDRDVPTRLAQINARLDALLWPAAP